MSMIKRARKLQEDSEDLKARAQKSVLTLIRNGMGPKEIEAELDGRVSWRTLYRWVNGERTPKRRSDVIALEKLCKKTNAPT